MAISKPLPSYARAWKAALVWRGWTVEELAAGFDARAKHERDTMSASTIYATQQARREPRGWEIATAAELLEVPEWFLRSGFDGISEMVEADGDVAALLGFVREVAAALDRLGIDEPEQSPQQPAATRRSA